MEAIGFNEDLLITEFYENQTNYQEKVSKFSEWAAYKEISLVGINKDADHFLSTPFKPDNDRIDLNDVPKVLVAAEVLYLIPDDVLEVMRDKTIYFSIEEGRGYAIVSNFPELNMLVGLNRGLIIEQEITKHVVLHELGHIVDYHGIQGAFEDEQNAFSELKPLREKIFKVNYNSGSKFISEGYLTHYSLENDDENFAEHFVYYVIYPEEFREKMKNDPLLAEKYKFFKEFIFSGKEY